MEPNILNDDLPVTGNVHVDHWLALVGALVPLMSALAGFLNNKVRVAQSEGQALDPKMLQAAQIVNLLAVNLDKAKQLGALARGKTVPTTTRGTVVNASAATEAIDPAALAEPKPVEPPKAG
jgi:hypothetical protein